MATAAAFALDAEAILRDEAEAPPAEEDQLRKWVESLSDEEAMRFAVTTCDLLTGVLLLIAVLTPAGSALAIMAASADALVRVSKVLLRRVHGNGSPD